MDVAEYLKKNDKISIMAVIKVDSKFNYYSPFSTNLS